MDKGRIDRFLAPGEMAVGNARHRLRTLLGSCVSILLWEPTARIGAMSHFLLPSRRPESGRAPDARYADEAMALMLRGLARHRVAVADCTAHLVGGGSMFPSQADHGDMGRRNGEAARALLQAHGLRTASEQLFGIGHRQVVFDIATGQVQSHQVHPEDAATMLQALSRLPGQPVRKAGA